MSYVAGRASVLALEERSELLCCTRCIFLNIACWGSM